MLWVKSGSAAIIVLRITSSICFQTCEHFSEPSRLESHCLKALRDHLKPSISEVEVEADTEADTEAGEALDEAPEVEGLEGGRDESIDWMLEGEADEERAGESERDEMSKRNSEERKGRSGRDKER
jgi:hypothetical protein